MRNIPQIFSEVVEKEWCIGCGMCAAVCPKNRLELCWNDRGEYHPLERDGCAQCGAKCDICYSVCPAHGNTKNETELGRQWYGDVEGIEHRDETGFHLASYIGYANRDRLRENGASGGMATWTLETLLESGEVDAVAAVSRTTNPEKFFEFRICNTVEEIRQCSRSSYYPVETSEVIRYILENEGRYAIIGLPCVCKAVRLAQEKLPKLKSRVRYVLGITCGHSFGKYFAEYLCALGSGNPHDLREITFRVKDDPSQPAHNYGLYFRSGEGASEHCNHVRNQDGMGFAFVNGYFQIPGCFYCDDVFAECADATFMDAWLPEYSNQPEGHSIVLTRDTRLKVCLDTAMKSGLLIKPLPISQTITSQQRVLTLKRQDSWGHIRRDQKKQVEHPRLREQLRKPLHSLWDLRILPLRREIAEKSPLYWNECDKQFPLFQRRMQNLTRSLNIYSKLKRYIRNPFIVLKRLLKKVTNH